MKKILFTLFIFTSVKAYSDCLIAYKQRLAFKEKRARENTSASAYPKIRANEAKQQVEDLELILSGRKDSGADRKLFMVCTDIIWSMDIPDRDTNSDRHCPIGQMFQVHKKFIEMVVKKDKNNEYCKSKDIGWLKNKIRGDRDYPLVDYNFNLHKEFDFYLKNIYFGW